MAEVYLDLNPDEQVVRVFRRHIINYLPVLFSTIVIVIVSILAETWLTTHATLIPSVIPIATITLGLLIIQGIAFAVAIIGFFVFRANRIVLTNQHLLQITQSGLFGRNLSKFSLDELQDVKGTRKGVFATIFNYGELLIQTAGESENFLFRPVGDPLVSAETINDTHENFEKAHTFIRP